MVAKAGKELLTNRKSLENTLSNEILLEKARAELAEMEIKLSKLSKENQKVWSRFPLDLNKADGEDLAKAESIGREMESLTSKIKSKEERIAFLELLQPKVDKEKFR